MKLIPLQLILASTLFSAPGQLLLRYTDLGNGGTARALATDRTGNTYIASNISDSSGRVTMRFSKLDTAGVSLASFDFPGQGFPQPAAIAVDPQGNVIVAGTAQATGFQVTSPAFTGVTGSSAFVVKLDAQLRNIIFSTLVSDTSSGAAVAVDPAGNIYLAGSETSPSFPVTPGAFTTTAPGGFVVALSPSGSLLYASQFGGTKYSCSGGSSCNTLRAFTSATAIAVDPSGAVVFAGITSATDLPMTSGALATTCNCSYTVPTGSVLGASFIAKLAPGGGSLQWATYLNAISGTFTEGLQINSIALDVAGNTIVGGSTPTIQTTSGVVQPTIPSNVLGAGFIAKINNSGSQLLWSTYMGTNDTHLRVFARVAAVAVKPAGEVAFTGLADLGSLPAFPGTVSLGTSYAGVLAPDGSSLQSLHVGSDNAAGQGIALSPAGRFISLGQTGALWMEASAPGPSILSTANAAGGPVSGLAAPFELISLYGEGIGPAAEQIGQVSAGSFTTSLGGYGVTFDNIPAALLYAGTSQINAIVPRGVAGQDFTHVRLVTPTGTVDGPTLFLRPAQPRIFQTSTGLSVALNQDGTVNSAQNPARLGSVVTVFGTGGEPANWTDGQIVPPNQARWYAAPVAVYSGVFTGLQSSGGLASLEVLYAGDAPGQVAGVMQINFRLPASFPPFNPLVFQVEIGGVLGGSSVIAFAP